MVSLFVWSYENRAISTMLLSGTFPTSPGVVHLDQNLTMDQYPTQIFGEWTKKWAVTSKYSADLDKLIFLTRTVWMLFPTSCYWSVKTKLYCYNYQVNTRLYCRCKSNLLCHRHPPLPLCKNSLTSLPSSFPPSPALPPPDSLKQLFLPVPRPSVPFTSSHLSPQMQHRGCVWY